jgi:iron(III) transport system substrate-binding protein
MANGSNVRRRLFLLLTFSIFHFPFAILLTGCDHSPTPREVVLYTSVDQPIAAPIVKAFEQKTGIHVILVTDAEATKSVGLAERIRAEKANPQCDVYWGNEPFLTINLAEEGFLAPYDSPSAKDVPDQFKDPQHRWAGNGLRARVLAVSGSIRESDMPQSVGDLADPRYKSSAGMARPTAGTTGGHVAAIYVAMGDDKAKAFFKRLYENGIKLVGGNSMVAEGVAKGTFTVGLSDNDDVAAAKADGGAIVAVIPDQNAGGTLMIPTTVGLVTDAPHTGPAKELIDFLLSRDVEKQLLDAKFVGWSIRDLPSSNVKVMSVDYREVAKIMPRAVREATAILEGRE